MHTPLARPSARASLPASFPRCGKQWTSSAWISSSCPSSPSSASSPRSRTKMTSLCGPSSSWCRPACSSPMCWPRRICAAESSSRPSIEARFVGRGCGVGQNIKARAAHKLLYAGRLLFKVRNRLGPKDCRPTSAFASRAATAIDQRREDASATTTRARPSGSLPSDGPSTVSKIIFVAAATSFEDFSLPFCAFSTAVWNFGSVMIVFSTSVPISFVPGRTLRTSMPAARHAHNKFTPMGGRLMSSQDSAVNF